MSMRILPLPILIPPRLQRFSYQVGRDSWLSMIWLESISIGPKVSHDVEPVVSSLGLTNRAIPIIVPLPQNKSPAVRL
jgi:hypothetical protein